MTLSAALDALLAAKRIREPVLPGMRVRPIPQDGPEWFRVHEDPYFWGDWEQTGKHEFDLTDPATLGCLLALVREASGEPELFMYPSPAPFFDEGRQVRTVWCPALRAYAVEPEGPEWALDVEAESEGAALAAALVALAEGL